MPQPEAAKTSGDATPAETGVRIERIKQDMADPVVQDPKLNGYPVKDATPAETGESATADTTPSQSATPEGQAATESATTTPNAGEAATGTFTQEQLEGIVKQRIERERKKYADYEDIKAKAALYNQTLEGQKSEQQKLQEQLAETQAQLLAREVEAKTSTLKSAVIQQAATKGFTDPEDAFRLIDAAELTLQDDGTVAGLAPALDKLLRAKPYLARKQTPAQQAVNVSRDAAPATRTDKDRWNEYFGGRHGQFWQGDGVREKE